MWIAGIPNAKSWKKSWNYNSTFKILSEKIKWNSFSVPPSIIRRKMRMHHQMWKSEIAKYGGRGWCDNKNLDAVKWKQMWANFCKHF